jgi:hypothetical protein
MPFRVDEDAALRIVRVTLQGVFDKPEIEKMVTSAREASGKNGWNILYDMRGAEPGKMSPAEVFWFPRQHPSLQAASAATVRVASLHQPKHSTVATFWENAFRNAGLQARAFTDEAAALQWLIGPS